MIKTPPKYYACDFETTVWTKEMIRKYGEQKRTDVWAYVICPLYDPYDTCIIGNNLQEFMDFFLNTGRTNDILYFHNLSFDGSFIVDWLLQNGYSFHHVDKNNRFDTLKSHEFDASISDMGQWYTITIMKNRTQIEIRDSLKLLPSSLKSIGKSLQTKHQKLEMEYSGDRKPYGVITQQEKDYIRNDGMLLKEALEMMFSDGHNKLTIGSCCLSEFKDCYTKKMYEKLFPDLRETLLTDCDGFDNAYDYIHKSYSGGWCYVNSEHRRKKVGYGCVYDANSHYPSQMSSKSGNYFPVGAPVYHKGEPSKELIESDDYKLFVRVRCRFKLKKGVFPWLHIRNNPLYRGNENLFTSDVRTPNGFSRYYTYDNKIHDTVIELILTDSDFVLLHETYKLYDYTVIDYLMFQSAIGLFDQYIDPYYERKQVATGFERFLCKLYLNNLYGKFAMTDDSSYKEPYMEENVVHFRRHEEHKKTVGYIAIGSYITSYARCKTIRIAIANKDRFLYSDTDSVHLLGSESPKGLVEDPTALCAWKKESEFCEAYYVRQKTYAERIVKSDDNDIEPFLELKASGLSKNAKKKFLDMGYDITDLDIGLELPESNLKAKRIQGGVLLQEMDFKIR